MVLKIEVIYLSRVFQQIFIKVKAASESVLPLQKPIFVAGDFLNIVWFRLSLYYKMCAIVNISASGNFMRTILQIWRTLQAKAHAFKKLQKSINQLFFVINDSSWLTSMISGYRTSNSASSSKFHHLSFITLLVALVLH